MAESLKKKKWAIMIADDKIVYLENPKGMTNNY